MKVDLTPTQVSLLVQAVQDHLQRTVWDRMDRALERNPEADVSQLVKVSDQFNDILDVLERYATR